VSPLPPYEPALVGRARDAEIERLRKIGQELRDGPPKTPTTTTKDEER
jgi:hypothetical protein